MTGDWFHPWRQVATWSRPEWYYKKIVKTTTSDGKVEVDEDGYEIVPPLEEPTEPEIKGIKCGLCGAKFDHNKSYSYSCKRPRCPIFMQLLF